MQNRVKSLPENFERFTDDLLRDVESVEGFLAPNEMRFLALLGAVPTADGEVLEIGSFKGKSTIILAKSSRLAGDDHVNAVDPMTAPSETDPDLKGDASSFEDFTANIEAHGVASRVRLHKTFSYELAKDWNRPLRLLWIDGDHTYAGTRADFEGFAPHLADGAIVAIHDVLHEFEGGIRVFMENILLSPNFGACGFCGSIAWGQFSKDASMTREWRERKLALYRKSSRLIPFVSLNAEVSGLRKKMYKVYRSRLPHAAVNPNEWIRTIR